MGELRTIDPEEVWVRHIKRGEGATARTVGRGKFVRPDVIAGEELGGVPGWSAAAATLMLDDDDNFTVELPNTVGADGVLHRRRFDIITSSEYEPGEEWLEFWRDANELITVGTPTDYTLTPRAIVVKGTSLGVALGGSISSEVDVWDAAAPADVLHHYTKLETLAYGKNLGVEVSGSHGAYGTAWKSEAFTGVDPALFTIDVRIRWTSQPAAAHPGEGAVLLTIPGWGNCGCQSFSGWCNLQAGGAFVRRRQTKTEAPCDLSLRIVARYDHLFFFLAGELLLELRRHGTYPAVERLEVQVFGEGSKATIDEAKVTTLTPFAGDGTAIDRRLPGIPPAIGLRGQWWPAASAATNSLKSTWQEVMARMWPLALTEVPAAIDRVEPQVNYNNSTAKKPPGIVGIYVVRWSGAVYLPLSVADRTIKLATLAGTTRLYVGRTLRGEEAANSWQQEPFGFPASLTSPSMRTWLGGSVDGWYPIVIEQYVAAATALTGNAVGCKLEEVVGGVASVLPTSRLSPIGVYSDVVRLTSHRQVFHDVATAFGYQWRTEPQSFESGKFPGELSARILQGRQTDTVIDDEVFGTEAQVQGSATDVVDGLIADAAGLSKPEQAQLTAQEIDYTRAGKHMALRQAYESLSDITDPSMLRLRLETLLGLRSSVNEQVGVRPTGQIDVTDTFPLTGQLAKFAWRPGDGVRLDLDRVDVHDATPRQLTQVTWPLKPDGSGQPEVGFRQRPRSLKALIRRLQGTIYGPRRTYQGQLATVQGQVGGMEFDEKIPVGVSDRFSRLALPSPGQIVSGTLNVMFLSGGSWKINISGYEEAEQVAVTQPGRYDITNWLKPFEEGAPYAYATLVGGTAGLFLIQLEVLARV